MSRLAPVRTNRVWEFYRRHMELTQNQWNLIVPHLPVQRGNGKIPNLQVLNAILYITEHGSKWHGLTERF